MKRRSLLKGAAAIAAGAITNLDATLPAKATIHWRLSPKTGLEAYVPRVPFTGKGWESFDPVEYCWMTHEGNQVSQVYTSLGSALEFTGYPNLDPTEAFKQIQFNQRDPLRIPGDPNYKMGAAISGGDEELPPFKWGKCFGPFTDVKPQWAIDMEERNKFIAQELKLGFSHRLRKANIT